MKHTILVLLLLSSLTITHGETTPTETFTLRDYLGRTWRNERVEFPMSKSQEKAVRDGKALVGPGGIPVLHQLVPGGIAFLADLDPFETRMYRFTDSARPPQTDVTLEETADFVRVGNGRTGVSIRKKLAGDEGPIERLGLAGQWIGGSRFANLGPPPTHHTVEVTARGPVFAEVKCQMAFAGAGEWTLTFRVQAHEPVVLVDETFSLGHDSRFVVSVGKNFSPDHLYWRSANKGVVTAWKIAVTKDDPLVLMWQPWVQWWGYRRGKWFGLYNEQNPHLLLLGARDSDAWVDPARLRDATVSLNQVENDLVLPMPLDRGQRRWMFGAFPKDECLAVLKEENLVRTPPPQQYVIKHEFPLNRIKDYVLQWPGGPAEHPRLFLTRQDVERFRKTFQPDPTTLVRYTTRPLSPYELDTTIPCYLGTGDAALGKHLATNAIAWVQQAVDYFFKQDNDRQWSLGTVPHHQSGILTSMNLADAILASEHLTPEQRDRIYAQVAFLGYTVSRADYHSPERGFAGTPNMTTTVAAYLTTAGCFIPSHPRAREWVAQGMKELKENELDHWADANGGWLEAPHYAMASYDYLTSCFLMAHRAGFNHYLFDPKMKKVIEWFAKISTPPDSRVKGWRHFPPIGHTWLYEPSGQFGTVAHLWRDKDPEFSAQMQWMFQQQGSQPAPGIGGFGPALAGYRSLLTDPSLPSRAPAYGSELFPEAGVVLRNQYPSDRETMLHLIAGKNHDHYDHDSGSITLWGKGRIVADDFGYYSCAPGEEHSMLLAPNAPEAELMKVEEFAPSVHLDYVRGVKQAWQRQIAFVKDADPLGANYFVLCDTLAQPAPATWRLWLTCKQVAVTGAKAVIEGNEDVDTDVWFPLPPDVALRTEQLSRDIPAGVRPDGTTGAMKPVQTALIATQNDARVFTTLIYPRLKTEKPPTTTSLADGRAVKIETATGTDYVFLSAEPFAFKAGDIDFEGTVGAVQMRGQRVVLALGAAGKIAARGHNLVDNKPAFREWIEKP